VYIKDKGNSKKKISLQIDNGVMEALKEAGGE
jgi:uncharacterized protein (DUF4415 family)